MGKTAEITEEFLNNGGSGLGYDETNLPEFKDIQMVWRHHIPIWEYKGQTEEEYYGIDE